MKMSPVVLELPDDTKAVGCVAEVYVLKTLYAEIKVFASVSCA
jgi:hypothetical protein